MQLLPYYPHVYVETLKKWYLLKLNIKAIRNNFPLRNAYFYHFYKDAFYLENQKTIFFLLKTFLQT